MYKNTEYTLPFIEYNKALKKDRLLGLKCRECGNITCPPMMVCRKCRSTDQEIVELSGRGKVRTFTTTYVGAEGRAGELPYTIVLVELEEGPWIMGNLIDMDPKKVTMDIIGRDVTLGHKMFPGDTYSNGSIARPLFSFA